MQNSDVLVDESRQNQLETVSLVTVLELNAEAEELITAKIREKLEILSRGKNLSAPLFNSLVASCKITAGIPEINSQNDLTDLIRALAKEDSEFTKKLETTCKEIFSGTFSSIYFANEIVKWFKDNYKILFELFAQNEPRKIIGNLISENFKTKSLTEIALWFAKNAKSEEMKKLKAFCQLELFRSGLNCLIKKTVEERFSELQKSGLFLLKVLAGDTKKFDAKKTSLQTKISDELNEQLKKQDKILKKTDTLLIDETQKIINDAFDELRSESLITELLNDLNNNRICFAKVVRTFNEIFHPTDILLLNDLPLELIADIRQKVNTAEDITPYKKPREGFLFALNQFYQCAKSYSVQFFQCNPSDSQPIASLWGAAGDSDDCLPLRDFLLKNPVLINLIGEVLNLSKPLHVNPGKRHFKQVEQTKQDVGKPGKIVLTKISSPWP